MVRFDELSFPQCGLEGGLPDGGATASEGPSCEGIPENCGPDSAESCCTSLLVPGGTFYRNYDGIYYEDNRYPATVSAFRLDKYEVTVGRYGRFLAAWNAGWRPSPESGKHLHIDDGCGLRNTASLQGEHGWRAEWDAAVAPTQDIVYTGTLPARANWYAAYAFCIWDGGFLPSDTEWNYAAAGGAEHRSYPWSVPPYAQITGSGYTYWCMSDPRRGGLYCTDDSPEVGMRPLGNGRWGHADLNGNVDEWTLDAGWTRAGIEVMPTAVGCVDCVYSPTDAAYRMLRGGGATYSTHGLHSYEEEPDALGGFRCARTPGASAGRTDDAGLWPPEVESEDIVFEGISAGKAYNCGVRADNGFLECWGIDNHHGRMSRAPTDVAFSSVALAPDHGCGVRRDDGFVECWGSDVDGQISSAPAGVAFASISAGGIGYGGGHTCGVRVADGLVECWGTDDLEVSGVPRDVAFESVSAGYGTSCGVRADSGFVQCWGPDYDGQISGIPADVRFDSVSVSGDYPGTFVCGVRAEDGFVKCWGRDEEGQVSGAPKDVAFTSVSTGARFACGVVAESGRAVCWGNDNCRPEPPEDVSFSSISAGNAHVCGIRSDNGIVHCWGWDGWGQVSDVPRDPAPP